MLFPTNVVENGSSANGGNGKDIIFHGPLIKLGTESFFTRQNRRYCFLLSDMILITKEERQERLQVRQVVSLRNTTISDLFLNNDGEKGDEKIEHVHHDFRLNAPEYGRNFVFRADSWNNKHNWILQLRQAIANLQAYTPNQAYGWHHNFSTDTIFYHSIHGNLKSLKKLQERLVLYNLRQRDENAGSSRVQESTTSSKGWAKVKARVHQLHEILSVDEDGATILHYASAYGHADIVEYLLSLGAFDINAMDHTLLSPLHCAASHRHPKVLETLLENGADHAVRDLEDRTPVYACVESSLYSTFSSKSSDIEGQAGGGGEDSSGDAEKVLVDCIKILAKYGCDLDACNSTGNSILMHASKGQNVEIVETLLKLGAGSLLRRASDGRNALHVACETNSQHLCLPILKVLISYGGKDIINCVADDGIETPMLTLLKSSACTSGSKKGAEALRLLEKHGARITEMEIALSGGILRQSSSGKQMQNSSTKDKKNRGQREHKAVVNGIEDIPVPPSSTLNIFPPQKINVSGQIDSPRAFA